ncbi:NmrA-like family protein [Ascosphaera apis ARSEF 7405]|uniref:NmrA-like family protein n=1 Tax=Ascosphaera apis ARSEF 7405 TaxID=392613 RepID=A0A168CTF6_9EURO|nr:NmrA-like family protein [Ascosphaera apis ARSEF 7405]
MIKAQNILLVGATGLIGGWILDAVIANKQEFQRIAIFTSQKSLEHKKERIEDLRSKHVEIVVGDIRDAKSVADAFEGFDTIISALGRDALLEQISLIDIAEQSKSVKWFFPSEYGTDIEYGPQSVHEKPHQLKLKVRERLRKIDENNLIFTCVVTGPFADGYIGPLTLGPRGGGFDAREKKANLLGDGDGKISLTTMADVGKLVVAALLHPEASRNRALKVNSFTTTPNDILAEFQKQTGEKQWDVTYTPLDDLKKIEEHAWADKLPSATPLTLRRIWTEGGTLYEKRDNELIGDPPMETLSDAVRRSLASY